MSRISLEKCREILQNEKLTDEEVLVLRDQVYQLIEPIITNFISNKKELLTKEQK